MDFALHGQAVVFGAILSVSWAVLLFAAIARRFNPFGSFAARFRGNSAVDRMLIAFAVATAVVYGGSKGNGGLRQPGISGIRQAGSAQAAPQESPEASIGLVGVRTNGVSLVAPSPNAVEVTAWRRVGGTEMSCWIKPASPFFMVGTNAASGACAAASGSVSFESTRRPPIGASLPDGTGLPVLCPLRAPLGFVPEAALPPDVSASRFWHDSAPGGGIVLTWENVLLDRMPGRTVSFQAELNPNGDCTFRYDFPDAIDPPPANFTIGAQMGGEGVNALAVHGTNVLSANVWRVDGITVSNGVSVAELLCTNGVLRTPASFALEWKNTTGLASAETDSDGDGISDRDETFLFGTDFKIADTDGDGIDDGTEILSGTDPLDADEDSDGVPDGADSTSYFSNPLWAASGAGNVVVSLESDIPPGSSATLQIGGLSIPLRQAGAKALALPDGDELDFRLFASGPEPVRLSISPGPDWNGDGFWLEDESGVFAVQELPARNLAMAAGARAASAGSGSGSAGSHGGTGRMGWVRVSLAAANPSEWDHESSGDYCVTSGGPLHLELLKNGSPLSSGAANVSLEGLSASGSGLLLQVPGTGCATLHGGFLLWGDVSASVSGHVCNAPENDGTCTLCGHAPGCVGTAATNMVLTLKHDADATLDVPVTGRGEDEPSIVSKRVEIRRRNESTWYRLCGGEFPRGLNVKVAGHFVLRPVAVDSDGHEYCGKESEMEVLFPSYEQIVQDATIVGITDAAWAATILDCSETNRRERGFWILLDTENNSYASGPTTYGPWVDNVAGAYVELPPRPSDSPASPPPNAGGCLYPVASFHCHTPTTYRDRGRRAGPSPEDNLVDFYDNVPGIVYDYLDFPSGSGDVPAGHPLHSPAKRYKSLGVERRPTP